MNNIVPQMKLKVVLLRLGAFGGCAPSVGGISFLIYNYGGFFGKVKSERSYRIDPLRNVITRSRKSPDRAHHYYSLPSHEFEFYPKLTIGSFRYSGHKLPDALEDISTK